MRISTLMSLLVFSFGLSAEEKKDYPVKNGKVEFEANGKHYAIPVFKGVKTVQVGVTDGIEVTYGIDIKSRKEAHAIEKEFTKFYEGKRIFGTKVAKFKEIDQGGSPGA